MIPLRLEVTNFLSYQETAVLDFHGIHLACISGPNGAGKSSILDSITWVLFGKCRSKSDDDVVNRAAVGGTADVRLTFALGDNTYRVWRRKRPRKTTELELQMATNSGPIPTLTWKALSESKSRETQAAIETLLRLNYDTFTNASFLLQGRADEFTTKTPNRRKEILAELLGVNLWETHKEQATVRRRAAETQHALLTGQLEDIEGELAEATTRQSALAAAKVELAQITAQRALQEQLWQQIRQVETAVQQQRQMIKNLSQNLTRARHTLTTLQQTQQQRQQERDSYQAILSATASITADYVTWQTAESTLQAWQEKANTYHRWQQAKQPFALTLAQERTQREQRQQELTNLAQRVTAAQTERQQVVHTQTLGQARLGELQNALAELAAQEQAWHAARTEYQRLEGEQQLLAQRVNQLQGQASRIQKLRQEETAVRRNLTAALAAQTDVAAKLAALIAQRERYAIALADKNTLEEGQPLLRDQMNKHKERIARLSAETGSECPLCGQPLSPTHRQQVLADLQQEGKEMGQRFRTNQERIKALTAEVTDLGQQITQADRWERELQMQQQRVAQAEARLAEITRTVSDWEAGDARQLELLTVTLADETALQAQRQRVQELATAVSEKQRLESDYQKQQRHQATTEARLGEIDRLCAEWTAVGAPALAEVQRQLAAADFAHAARTELAHLEAQLTALGYDAAAHRVAQADRDRLAPAVGRWQQLQQAEAAVQPLTRTLADLQDQVATQTQTVAELAAQQEIATAQLAELQAHTGNAKTVEDELFRLRESENKQQRAVGAAQQRLAVLDDLRQQHKELQERKTAVSLQIQRLKMLEKAFGRDGVQALLIEQALPEIEDRANDLLDRLTGGEMHVSFNTQRQLKSREGTAETLDIHIQDGVGERPYENFSGGEQFRVNFAIRLALSQVLARRAGASLQTLVIDEGFGSQDPNGRQRLVEAINTIQTDFARILVITHIDELRDAFPTRIEISKSATGSHITVF